MKLTEEQKAFIVEDLACFRTPSEVVRRFKERFGADCEIDRKQVYDYNPDRTYGQRIAKQWVQRFAATRKRYLEETADIAIASRGFRLRELQDMYLAAREKGAVGLAASLLEQAAKELQATPGASAAKRAMAEDDPLTPEEMRTQLALKLQDALAKADATKH